jgi:biotin carboxyl carrier protein
MFYYTEVGGSTYKVEIYQNPEGATYVRVADGPEMKVDFDVALGEDLFSLLVDNQSHEIHIEPGDKASDYEVTLDGQIYQVNVETERQHRLSALAPRQQVHTGEIQVKAPMPGLVTIVAVEVGQAVEQGQRVAVLEAMKMENELRAPRAGTIKAVNVQSGQTVEQNKVLAIIE